VMHALAVRHPGYRWERNVGYATAAHLEGLGVVGLTKHHRRSFIPVRQLSLDFGTADLAPGESPPVEIDFAALSLMAAD